MSLDVWENINKLEKKPTMATKKKAPKKTKSPDPIRRNLTINCSLERIFPVRKNIASRTSDFTVTIEATDFLDINKEKRTLIIQSKSKKTATLIIPLGPGKKPLSVG